jgi:outer membrane receptor protein involved in Fe transport
MNRLNTIVWTFLLVMGVLSCQLAYGQGIATGSISGTVTDPSGAVVPGAKVTAQQTSTNRVFNTVTNSEGIINLPALPIGTYVLKIEAARFKNYESSGLGVEVGKNTALGIVHLELGEASETVTVEGTAPLLQTESAQVTNTFSSEKVQDLPVGNTFDSLSLFVPGVATAGDASFGNNNGAELSVNGQRARSNNFELDGQSNNDNSISGPMVFFGNQDTIAEVQVITNFDAEYGRNMGAVVNYVTKSGTNQFHGSAYEFWQGDHFDSLENQEILAGLTVPPQFVDNRFGGTVGGPIKKDRIWFFGSANLERQRTGGLPSSSTPGIVPTPAGMQALEAAFPNSPGVALLAAVGPESVSAGNPVYTDVGAPISVTDGVTTAPIQFGTVTRFIPSPFNDYEATGRVDFKITDKDNFFVRYIFQKLINDGVNFGNGIDVGDWQTVPGKNQQLGLDWIRTWSPVFVNQVRLSFSRERSFFEEGSRPNCTDSDPTNCPPDIVMVGGAPQDSVTYGQFPEFPQGRTINVYTAQDNVSWQLGKHTLKFGGEYDLQRSPNEFLPLADGLFVFGSFDDLVANTPAATEIAYGNFELPFHENDASLYVQDDWHVKDNLTVNLGLRWEYYQQAINLLHQLSAERQAGTGAFWDTSLPASQTTVPEIPENLHNFGPVVGFAWTPRVWSKVLGEDKTVIRGGFRIGYDPIFYNMFLNVATASPLSFTTVIGAPIPVGGVNGTTIANGLVPSVPFGGNPGDTSVTTVSSNFHNPYTEQWSFGIQRAINNKMVAEVRYVGNHTVGNFQFANFNPDLAPLISAGFGNLIPAGMTPCSDATAPGFGFADCNHTLENGYDNGGWSKYNGLQTELRIGQWHNLTSTVSYTWSHTMDNTSEVFSTLGGGNTLSYSQNPFDNDVGERANSGIDFPNVFGLTLIYDIPYQREQVGVLGHLLGGWQMNTTFRYTSGQPYTVIQDIPASGSLCDPSETMSTTTDACRPILASASAPLNSVGQCTDPAASDCGIVNFVTGAATTMSAVHWILNDGNAAKFFGTPFDGVGRNTLRGQPLEPVNLSFYKNTKIRENMNLQFQATAFNVLNTQFLGVPDPVLQDAASGSFNSVAFNGNGGATFAGNTTFDGIARRRLLFGLKLIF